MSIPGQLSSCGELVRTHDPDRYLCCLFASPHHREALFSLYAFNYEVARISEVVSETLLGHIRLQWWRESLDGIQTGHPRAHEVVKALAGVFYDVGLDREPFDAVLDAREADLQPIPFKTFEDLLHYAQHTSGVLARVGCRVVGLQCQTVIMAAEEIATAWALVGSLRATPFLARSKRLMLPLEVLEVRGGQVGDHHAMRDVPAIRETCQEVGANATRLLTSARDKVSNGMLGTARPILLLARLATLYLERLERAGWNPYDPAINAPMPLKSWSLWWAALTRRV